MGLIVKKKQWNLAGQVDEFCEKVGIDDVIQQVSERSGMRVRPRVRDEMSLAFFK